MNNEMAFELKEHINIIKKGKWFIIIVTLLSTIITAIYSFHNSTPNYVSMVTIVPIKVSSENTNQTLGADITITKGLMETYSQILQSNAVAIRASEKISDDINADMIKSSCSVSTILNTQVLTLEVQAPTPQNAVDIAQAVNEAFQEEIQEIYPFTIFKVVDEPQLPENPISQGKAKKIATAFLLGLLASIAIILARDYFDMTIKTKRDVSKYLGLTVIGDIYRYNKK